MLTIFTRIVTDFTRSLKDQDKEGISLEALSNKIRLVVWFFLFTHLLGITFLSNTRLPTIYYVLCLSLWLGYLYLLLKSKNEFLKGIPFIIMNIWAALALLQKGEPYYLRIITLSLPTLPIYSVQGFPPGLILVLGGAFLWIQKYFQYYLDTFYEPITSSYMIPAMSIENILKGYQIGLLFEIFCLMTYQTVVQRLWKKYKKTKQNLEEINKKLQAVNDQFAHNNQELDRLNQQLKNALKSQDLFIACVSHELRNPLNAMLGNLDLLEPHIKETNQTQLLRTMKACGEALLGQINNLLDVAKINANKLEINEFSTNMGVFIDKFWLFTRIGLEKKGLQGHLTVDKNLSLWLNIDSHRLQQILNNLVGNAIKFTKEGSIRITFRWIKGSQLTTTWNTLHEEEKHEKYATSLGSLEIEESFMETSYIFEGERQKTYPSLVLPNRDAAHGFINFKVHQPVKDVLEAILPSYDIEEDTFIKIEIVDTGCGMSEEAQETIFQPFVQGDRSITREYGGTGLGLYIVRELVTKMGGNIKINSLKDVGTLFQIILPAKTLRRVQNSRQGEVKLPHIKTEREITFEEFRRDSNRSHSEKALPSKGAKPLKRALIVDDDLFNQKLLKEYFKKFSFDCDVAKNGFEGVQMYQSNAHKYSFISMDIQMPIMDGITACKKIREFEKEISKPKVPIIMITGNCTEDERKICLDDKEIEASYFFRKPFRLIDCKLFIEKLLAENLKTAL